MNRFQKPKALFYSRDWQLPSALVSERGGDGGEDWAESGGLHFYSRFGYLPSFFQAQQLQILLSCLFGDLCFLFFNSVRFSLCFLSLQPNSGTLLFLRSCFQVRAGCWLLRNQYLRERQMLVERKITTNQRAGNMQIWQAQSPSKNHLPGSAWPGMFLKGKGSNLN